MSQDNETNPPVPPSSVPVESTVTTTEVVETRKTSTDGAEVVESTQAVTRTVTASASTECVQSNSYHLATQRSMPLLQSNCAVY